MATYQQSAIIWPKEFLPGTTDNFVSNEIYATGVKAADIWALLADVSKWQSCYENCENMRPPSGGSYLSKGAAFKFDTFGWPDLPCVVQESQKPESGIPGRLAWSIYLGEGDTKAGVYHAWIVEDLDYDRVRILTQESQWGKPAAQMGQKRPNKMLLGHQDWLVGLVNAAKGQKTGETNLASVGGPNT